MTDQQLPEAALLLQARQSDTAYILQQALLLLEHNPANLVDIAARVATALCTLDFYWQNATDEHKRDMKACLSAAVDRKLKYIELAKAYQSATHHLHGVDAVEAGRALNLACGERYRADIAAAIVCGDVDSSLALWAGFFIHSWTHCGGLDLMCQLIQLHGIAEADIISYLKTDVVIVALSPDERQQMQEINKHGATIYRGANGGDSNTGLCWSLSEDVAIEFARRRGSETSSAFLYTADLKPGGALLYLAERGEQEIVINPEYLTITDARFLWDFDPD